MAKWVSKNKVKQVVINPFFSASGKCLSSTLL